MNYKIRYKLFLKILLSIISTFLVYHLVMWYGFTSKIFDRNDSLYVGDIGRMSYQIDSLFPRKLEYTLERKLLNHNEYKDEKIDVLTTGDSFSNAATGGLNPYYQDYLATKYNKKILNVVKLKNHEHDLFELIIVLYNNGWLKEHKPEMIIVESSERAVYTRFAKEFDFSSKYLDISSMIVNAKKEDSYIPELLFINTANYKVLYYTLKYNFFTRASKSVVKVNLSKDLFTTKRYANKLLFHYDDIKMMENNSKKIKQINDNFNKLAILLKSIGIKLVFMPAVDKYDLYSDFVTDNKYPKNKFFDIIRPLKKDYYFVDTKKILLPLLKDGVKDVYYSDDTHWSYKASDMITDDFVFKNNLK